MGNSLLMKNTLLIFLILTFILFQSQANELKWVDEQIEAIKPNRKGINKNEIDSLKSPFIFLIDKNLEISKKHTKQIYLPKKTNHTYKKKIYKPIKKAKTHQLFILEAIINKTAFINGKWYKLGDNINKYILKEISPNRIVLIKGTNHIILSTDTKNSTLKFKN